MLDRAVCTDAAARWGTPLYLTDLDTAAARLAAYQAAFPGALIAYAVKANPDPLGGGQLRLSAAAKPWTTSWHGTPDAAAYAERK